MSSTAQGHSFPAAPGTVRALFCAVVCLLALGGTSLASAQTAETTVSGIIRARSSATVLGGATITVEGTDRTTRSDSLGRYTLRNVPPGPQVLHVRRLGYAPSRTPVTVPASGALSIDIIVATSALQLDQLVVTADQTGRARGELGTASVIDRDAIANQIAASLQGILELIPGVPLQPPGLDATAQFSLRSLAQSGTGGAGGVSGPSAADIASSGTLIVLDGIPLSNNANLQGVGARGEIAPAASTAGGGIDLRRIPAATLERVEVIRGIPSARWGDLTQGAIIVDTRAAATSPEFAGRFDPRTAEGNLVGGRAFATERQALTVTGNLAETRSARTLSNASTLRGAGQIAYRMTSAGTSLRDGRPVPRLTLDARLDWWQLRFDSPERVDIEVGRNSFQNDQGIRLGQRATLALGGGMLQWTAAYDHADQLTRESKILSRPTTPFTDRLTEGRNIGSYIEGPYRGEYSLAGAPRMVYSRLEWERQRRGTVSAQVRAGMEARREWNAGDGYTFDIAKPPQASPFNGTAGYDRPRRFSTIAPLATSGVYLDSRFTARRGAMVADLQPGLRLETLHEAGWTDGVRSAQLQPRLTAQLAPRPWVRLRAGIGVVSKAPTIAQLNPATQYYDLVNVNRFTPDPRERLAVVTTFLRNPRNPDLGLSRARKQEIGFELDGGARRGAISVVWFDDRIRGAVTLRREPDTLRRARYALADTGIGTGRPGRIIDPPIANEAVPIFLDRSVNGGTLGGRGAEFTVALPVIPQLRTRLEVSGAQITTDFTTDDRNYGPANLLGTFQLDTAARRVAYFEGVSTESKRAIVTWRLVHHQPDLGLIITTTLQQRLATSSRTLSARDALSFAGYLTRDGVLTPVPVARRNDPEFADLRAARASVNSSRSTSPDDWLMSLQIAKSFARNGRLSFYYYNVTDKFLTISGGGVIRALPTSRFGVELTVPTVGLFGCVP
jgi:TonB dependent receptor/CarboxypepD_reg-like domain/TonB-dependent Receptor Plug Domain